MAVQILSQNGKIIHHPAHNLELIFYVLLWVCCLYEGPNNTEKVFRKKEAPPLTMWCQAITHWYSLIQIHASKNSDCSTLDEFDTCVISHFPPYFDDLKECCCELHHLFFGQTEDRKDATHDQMTAVFWRCLDALPLKENQPGAQGKPVAAYLDATSATSSSSDGIQEEDEEDIGMECECNENDANVDNGDEESVCDSNDQSRSEDAVDVLEASGNMMPDLASVYHQGFWVCSASPSIHSLSPCDAAVNCRTRQFGQ